jgi:hypothetical protein
MIARAQRIAGLLMVAALAGAQNPGKPDLPYLKQAAELIPLEVASAKKEGTRLVIEGAGSPVKTPISLPVFFLKAEKIAPEGLQLFRVEVKDGHREAVSGGDVLHMEITRQGAGGVFRIAVSDPLDAGEYVLAGEGTRVFGFAVF